MIRFIRQLFDPKGDVSWGRFGSFVALLFLTMWINYAVFAEQSPLQVLKELPWTSFAAWISALYLIGKTNETVQGKKDGGGNAP